MIRLHRVAWATLSLLCLPLAASAQNSDNSINLHHHYHAADGEGFTTVSGARTLEAGSLHVHGIYGFAHEPLETRQSGGGRGRGLIDAQHTLDLAAAYGITDWLDVGLALPLILHHDGRRLNLIDDVRKVGLGALRFEAKATLVDQTWDDLSLAIALRPYFTLPTGRASDYLSDNSSVTGGGNAIVELNAWRLRFGLEVGYEFISSDIDLGDLEIDDRLRYGAAVEFFILRPDPPEERKEPPAEPPPAQPADEQPADETPADEAPADEQPADEAPADEQPADEAPADEQPADEAPADEQPADEAPADEQPADEAPADDQPADETADPLAPEDAPEAPADETPADGTEPLAPEEGAQPADEQPADAAPAPAEPAREEEPARRRSPHALSIGGEIYGWSNGQRLFQGNRDQPVEAFGFARYRHTSGFLLHVGVGGGLNNGIGAADLRVIAQIGWSF